MQWPYISDTRAKAGSKGILALPYIYDIVLTERTEDMSLKILTRVINSRISVLSKAYAPAAVK